MIALSVTASAVAVLSVHLKHIPRSVSCLNSCKSGVAPRNAIQGALDQLAYGCVPNYSNAVSARLLCLYKVSVFSRNVELPYNLMGLRTARGRERGPSVRSGQHTVSRDQVVQARTMSSHRLLHSRQTAQLWPRSVMNSFSCRFCTASFLLMTFHKVSLSPHIRS